MMDRGIPRAPCAAAGGRDRIAILPSVYLRLGVDGDGDGRSDIWNSMSTARLDANSFATPAGSPISPGVRRACPRASRARWHRETRAPRCPASSSAQRWLSVGEWRRLGVMPMRGGLSDREMASLIEPDGPGATAYLTTNNYRTILDYNCSNFYALSVLLLADGIGG